MKQKPSIKDEEIRNLVESYYNIDVVEMVFVPQGEVAYSYTLTSCGTKYFAKLYETNNLTNKGIQNLEAAMQTVSNLYKDQGIEQIISPIENRDGKFRTVSGNFSLVVMNYIEGQTVNEEESKTKIYLEKIGELLARIHNTTNEIESNLNGVSGIHLNFKKDLLTSIEKIKKVKSSKNENFIKLRKLMNDNMEYILTSLEYLECIIGNRPPTEKNNLVLCHTDPNRNNVIINDNGKIFLIDWDSIVYAPFESDIWFFMFDENLESLIEGYKKVRQVDSIDEEYIVYQFYQRVLDDLTDWIYRILFEKVSEEQIQSDFEGLEEDVWPLLPNMKKIEKTIRNNCKKWLKKE